MATALTGTEVVSAISKLLRAKFTTLEAVKIYKDKPIQGMQKPCFFLHQINFDSTPEMKTRAQRDYLVDVRYHPKDTDTEALTTMNTIAEKLSDALCGIPIVGQTVKSGGMNSTVVDGVLHFIVSYSFKAIKQPETQPLMGTINITERVN